MKYALPRVAVVVFLVLGAISLPVSAQLFDNLKALGGSRYAVGDPSVTATNREGDILDGPKDVVASDLDGDGKPDLVASDKDGSVTVRYGIGDGSFGEAVYLRAWTGVPPDAMVFAFTNVETEVYCDYQPTNAITQCYTNIFFPPLPNTTNRICLTNMTDGSVFCTNVVFPPLPMPPPPPITNVFCQTNFQFGCVGVVTNLSTNVWHAEGPFGFRGLAVADFTGDGLGDIAVAAPGEQVIYLFINGAGRHFAAPTALPGWFGVRDLATGDFDGDGRADLVAAGTTNGLVQYRSHGDGTFQIFPGLTNLASTAGVDFDDFDFPQPAYYLKAFRYPGETRDELVVSFAQRQKIWVLQADAAGQLVITGDVENVSLTSLDVGRILTPADSGAPPDLLTAYSRGGCLDVFPGATNLAQRFSGQFVQRHFIPGAPRNVRIVDLDQDNWNDVVVVAQAYDRVLIYKNNHGMLEFTTETFSGRFPREMDVGRFNEDDRPDLAVLNRYSSDISVFLTATNFGTPVGFLALDSVYPVDGSVSGLEVLDFNKDMRPDVLQLHRDTSEFSVRFTDADGKLGPAVYYAITNAFNPAAQIAVDVNGDGAPDMVTANLSGSVTVRLGLPDGTFGPEQTFHLPANASGSLFALVPGDFNGDGKIDLAAGYLDCRVTFFKGDGTGGFTFVRTEPFIYEPRSMAAVDCDQDGDLDLVGGALTGSFVVVENKGTWFDTNAPLVKVEYPGGGYFDTNVRIVDQNSDGDPDLLFGSSGGFTLFVGGPGLTFARFPIDNGNNDPGLSGSTFVFADLDGDGDSDIASICSSNSCLSIRVQTNGIFQTVLTVPVPITRYLATGDLDKDGFADLVGSGDVLWVALSSRRATNAAPAELLAGRAGLGIVINEVLAANSSVPLLADGGRDSDFVELFNASTLTIPLSGWRMGLISSTQAMTLTTNLNAEVVVVTNNVVSTNFYLFPLGSVLLARDHRVLVCSDRVRTAFHTGFTLPAQGGTIVLYNGIGAEVDRVAYPAVNSDQSYARYTDGARRFVVNNIPSPDSANVDNGAVLPTLTLTGVDLETIRTPGVPLRFRAHAQDDIGLVNVSLLWRRLDIPDNQTKRVILFDDGMNEDGPANDGAFLGVLNESLPAGAEIQFYLECTDITGQVESTPGNPRFVSPGQRAQMHALAIAVPAPALEISEVVADNVTGLVDELGGRPDWVEVRNVSSQVIPLGNVSLGPRMFGNSDRLSFTNRPAINPGEHIVIYADGNSSQGQLHAPFNLNRLGEQLQLVGTTASGARFVIDSLRYGPQVADVALSRLGPGGVFVANTPTPRTVNVVGPWQAFKTPFFVHFAFPTRAGATYGVEYKVSLDDPEWILVTEETSVGAELVITDTMQSSAYLRVYEK